MDMAMDVPAPEELEWLETNALIPEEELLDDEESLQGEENGRVEEDSWETPAPKTSDPSRSRRKRHCPEEKDDSGASGNREKGTKRPALHGEEEPDEDWLRYSPPKGTEADVAPEADDPAPPVLEEKILSRFAWEIKGDCIPVTGPNADRVYAKIKMSSGENDGEHRNLIREKQTKGLLLESINNLIERVEQEAFTEALQESFGSPTSRIHSRIPSVSEQLWVEKYAPSSFTELLSDEQTNREVLLWLKQWDSCVFGSQVRATTDDVLSALRRHSSAVVQEKFSDNSSFLNKNKRTSFDTHNFKLKVRGIENNNLNGFSELSSRKSMQNQAPEQKVLLLCGPPGLGKTTLAHVAAKHCGYRVVEINASDDRSTSTIESKILGAVQMNSVIGDSKPKCLVIDEIDGALGEGKGAVEVILRMIAAEKKSNPEKGNADQEVQSGKASLRKGHRTATLSRPVICICNDLYAPALRPLRQVAKVHIFMQPTVSRVVNRLKYICKREGFKTNSIALSALAEYTECDIRACLNTLQFLNKKKEALNILDVGPQVVGHKDMSRSAFDVWKEVFQKRKSKRERISMNRSSGQGDFDFLYSLLSNRGEHELIMDGIYENFIRISYHDPMMQKTVKCLDMLGVSDSLHQFTLRTQQLPLHVYQPSIAITMRYLIAQVPKPNIEWPKSLQRCRTMLSERKDTLKIWQNKISPFISRHLSTESFSEDIVSSFLHILSPPTLRPVALHLLSESEKDDLAQLVDTMVSYSITYKNSKPESLQKSDKYGGTSDVPMLSLDPPIDDLVNFKDYQSGHAGLSLAMRQVLVHEVEKQKILRESTGRFRNPTNESNVKNQASPVLSEKVSPAVNISTAASVEDIKKPKSESIQRQKIASSAPNTLSEVKKKNGASGNNSQAPGDLRRPCNRSSSFFDRFRKGSSTESKNLRETLQKAATIERDSRPFLFKYNEGFTNAVKRPVKIRELLP